MKAGQGASSHRVGEGAVVTGELTFSGRLEIDGEVIGMITAEPVDGSEVIIGPKGRVQGTVTAASVVVAGRIDGPVRAAVRLEVAAGARIRGDVAYRDLQVQHGAVIEGSLQPADGGHVALKLVANTRT